MVWSNPPPPTYVGAGVWRLIAVSPRIPSRLNTFIPLATVTFGPVANAPFSDLKEIDS